VWFDRSAPAVPDDVWLYPGDANPTGSDDVAAEARRAAAHFGNATAARDRDAIYVVNEPAHFASPGYGFYCGYHDSAGASYGPVVYVDLPHVTDLETPAHQPISCGQNAVNRGAAGQYDGVSIVAGHEFAEAVTDPYPGTGWLDAKGNEAADKCQNVSTGPGAPGDLRLATGTFAVQGIWSNVAGGCRVHGGDACLAAVPGRREPRPRGVPGGRRQQQRGAAEHPAPGPRRVVAA
jgi:serine protease